MPRRPRIVVPGLAHHIVQQGNNRQPIFFCSDDRMLYLDLLGRYSRNFGVRLLGYCLMNEHVHLLAIPDSVEALARTLGGAHAEYALAWNKAEARTGHLWQNRFQSCPVEHARVSGVLRYVERNPVRSGLVLDAWEWPWSSAPAHVDPHAADPLLGEPWGEPLAQWRAASWREHLGKEGSAQEDEEFERCTATGQPFGSGEFVQSLERTFGRRVTVGSAGRPRIELRRVARLYLTSS
jgi:putative transposase